jgi:YHS domain-containing protein
MPSDPVCRIDLDEQNAIATSEFQGKIYWFCTHTCKEAFEEDPERFIKDISIKAPTRPWWRRFGRRAQGK